MKATVNYFACNYRLTEKTGYKHEEEIPFGDIFNVTEFIFGMGLNVMLQHVGDNGVIIWVDDKRFQQR